jgi:hypothetical protein
MNSTTLMRRQEWMLLPAILALALATPAFLFPK